MTSTFKKIYLASVFFLVIGFAIGWYSHRPAKESSQVYATWDGQTIRASDILPSIQSDLDQLEKNKYQIKRKATENFVQQQLIEKKQRAVTANLSAGNFSVAKLSPQAIELSDSEIDTFLKVRNLDRKKMSQLDMDNVINNLKLQKRLQAEKLEVAKSLQDSNIRYKIPLPPEDLITISAGRFPSLGPEKATVEIIFVSNFNCPRRLDAEKKIFLIKEKYKDQVKISYRFLMNEPDLSMARVLAESVYCANDQKKFWDYYDHLVSKGDSLSLENRFKDLEKIGIDAKQLERCTADRQHKSDLEKDMQQLAQIPRLQPPSVVINGRLRSANESIEEIFLVIDQDL